MIIISPEDAEEIAAATYATMKKEEKIMADIVEKGEYIRPWVDEKLREIGCEM